MLAAIVPNRVAQPLESRKPPLRVLAVEQRRISCSRGHQLDVHRWLAPDGAVLFFSIQCDRCRRAVLV